MIETAVWLLQFADIDLEAGTMKGGLKTDAGKNDCPYTFYHKTVN